ncbi:MAG: hypothetical protein IPH16_15655 [Haliscomenobacter sp.]|nr:hypothetical protein [Haliscomenobacter sp.]
MKYVYIAALSLAVQSLAAQSARIASMNYSDYPVYSGKDLGLNYTSDSSTFKVWSPSAKSMRLLLYQAGEGGEPQSIIEMDPSGQGVWKAVVKGDLKRRFYAFQTQIRGKWSNPVPDPYAKALGVNGMRAQVLDLEDTHPANWSMDRRPELKSYNDIVLYELHVRDLSSHAFSGSHYPGKYLAFMEKERLVQTDRSPAWTISGSWARPTCTCCRSLTSAL